MNEEATPAAILEYYQNLQVRPSDVLLFHYAGHGGMTHGPRDHTFQMRRTLLLSRSDLRNAMRAKNAALVVILTDCCSNYPQKKRPIWQEPPIPKPGTDDVKPGFQQMFFRTRGVVDITGAQDGKLSHGHKDMQRYGGLFSAALRDAFLKAADMEGVTWADVHPMIKDEMTALNQRYQYTPPGVDQSSRAFGLPGSYWGFTASRGQDAGGTEFAYISDVHLDSVAERAGLQSNDIVVGAGSRAVRTLDDLVREIGSLPGGAPLRLSIRRGDGTMPVVVERP
jgi:hypothetical protein